MRRKDSLDLICLALAVIFDIVAVVGGFLLATWMRFDSGWIPLRHDRPDDLYVLYATGAGVATLFFLLACRTYGLYVRPQTGRFTSKIPRLIRTSVVGIFVTAVLAFSVQNDADFSRLAIGLALPCILFFVLLERYILFRLEWNLARHSPNKNGVIIIGTDQVAARLRRTFYREPMLRQEVIGFLCADSSAPAPDIPDEFVRGDLSALPQVLAEEHVEKIVLTDSRLSHDKIVDIIMLCEQHVITFNMVPDLFRVLTGTMDVQSIDDIPLLGVSDWPLDRPWSRLLKRAEDVAGALFGLIVLSPVMGLAAIAVKLTSPGPVLYSQERCGRDGEPFTLYKFRTMQDDAETRSGPVFTAEDDPRVTRIGRLMRRHNVDELPQLWNVLRGQMSLIGPRPERPHFVECFRSNIGRYMWRHVSRPGMTGWAQVNGLRGNTSIEERIKYDLYYLEHWSLAFDFKILLRTLLARENAY